VFALVHIFGILLIRSVRKEVEQRERLEVLTKELAAANERLKELDKLKSEFLSFASHQVKSPMAAVKGYATLIYDGTFGLVPDKVKEVTHKIKASADRMIALVDNLLDLRKIEEGKMEYDFVEVEVAKFVSEIVEELSPLASDKKLELSFEGEPSGIKIKADAQKLRQVIQNLIDNAAKYTQAGWVRVSVNPDQDKKNVLITVADSGLGISKELLPNLFQQFRRDTQHAKAIKGTGLGLYIAKEIVTAHSGEIWAESEGEGKGSRFFVKVPILQ
jgi:signal transduction histidine kinase